MKATVKFPIAKLLKEKRYSELCLSFYSNESKVETSSLDNWNENNGFSAPTITEVVMWLYEKHGIWIWVEKYGDVEPFVPQIPKANLQKVLGFYNSPTEAYESAIEYCLTNLI